MKKYYSLLILFCCVSSIYAYGPYQDLAPTAANKLEDLASGDKIFLKHADECLEMIAQAAGEIPMTGVAMVAFIPGDSSLTWISKMKVVGRLADDKANILGIVYTKGAEMAATLQNSGNPDRKDIRGEFGYIGGIIEKVAGGYLLAAFSGGKGEDDVAAASIGLDWFVTKFNK